MTQAIRWYEFVLKFSNLKLNDVNHIVFFEKPFLKFEDYLKLMLRKKVLSFSKAIPLWIKEKLFQKNFLFNELKGMILIISQTNIFFSEHHLILLVLFILRHLKKQLLLPQMVWANGQLLLLL